MTLIVGDDDGLWPSQEYADRIAGRLKDLDWPGTVRVECVPGAGHFVGFPMLFPPCRQCVFSSPLQLSPSISVGQLRQMQMQPERYGASFRKSCLSGVALFATDK